jgi:5'-nucleotidase
MTVILTNDDGIDALGIRALATAIEQTNLINKNSIFVAPNTQYSSCGHQVTTLKPIQVEHRSEKEYAVFGTPADCIRLAIYQLCPQIKWVISGINHGGNMGVDVYISGTVAAVREAAFHGIPGIALSQYRKGKNPINWQQTTRWTIQVLNDLLHRPLQPGCFWNVNFPYVEPQNPDPEIVFCQPSTEPLHIDYQIDGDQYYYKGVYAQRQRRPGTDVEVCLNGNIAVTQLQL